MKDLLSARGPRLAYGPLHLKGNTAAETKRSRQIISEVLSNNVRLIDTADSYCIDDRDFHANERLISQCLTDMGFNRSNLCIITKGGLRRPNGLWLIENDDKRIAANIAGSVAALGGRPIDVWLLHSRSQRQSLKDRLKPALQALDKGQIKALGLCSSNCNDVKEAASVYPLAAVQTSFSIWSLQPIFTGIIAYCEQKSIPLLCARPLGGPQRARFLNRLPLLAGMAHEMSTTTPALTISWLLHQSPVTIPILSSGSLQHLQQLLTATRLCLSEAELRFITRAIAGIRLSSLGEDPSNSVYYNGPTWV